MDLHEYFRTGIEIDLSEDKSLSDALDELGTTIAKAGGLADKASKSLRKAFLDRENNGTTAFGFGYALPHIFHSGLKKIHVAVVRHPTGVNMGAFDGVPTRTMICIAAPEDHRETYLALLKYVAGVTRDKRWRSFMDQSPSAAGVLDVLVEAGTG
jgi:PTS system fructose-specific IIC component